MTFETTITRAWHKQAAWLWLLLPISWLYGMVVTTRRYAYRRGWLSSYRAPIPVMVIGNISVGGSGKTPLIITLVTHLQQQGVKVGVISRGYGGAREQMPALVYTDSLPDIVGDEPCLIVAATQAPMAVCPDRKQAIETLLAANPDLQMIIADDGLQHHALKRDIEWIVVDSTRGFGNQQLLPTGFLREPISRLEGSTVIYHQAPNKIASACDHQSDPSLTMQLVPSALQPIWQASQARQIPPKAGDTVHAVSGIGYPQRFFDTLAQLQFNVIGHPYPDHHAFHLNDLYQYTEHPIIITSKDAVKIRPLLQAPNRHNQDRKQALAARLWVLPVTAALSNACYQTLEQQLRALGIVFKDNDRV